MLLIILFGSIVSLTGTMAGAFLGVTIRNPSDKLLGAMVGFAGGLMMSIVMLDLLPESLNKWSFKGTLLFCVLGIIIIAIIDTYMDVNSPQKSTHMKVAFMAAIGLMIHNLPEGIIMGCGFMAGQSLGLKMSLVISIHDIPEGMAVAAPLMVSRTKVSKILLYSFLTALPTAVGVWIGAFIGNISADVLGASMSLASGIMLYVVCGELLPESNKLWKGLTTTMGVLFGILMGLIITNVL
jgi:ZIP family zinc transporter